MGYLVAVPLFVVTGFHAMIAALGCLVMFLDWLLQALQIKKSNNIRRLVTGVLGGYGIISLQLYVIVSCYLILIHTKK